MLRGSYAEQCVEAMYMSGLTAFSSSEEGSRITRTEASCVDKREITAIEMLPLGVQVQKRSVVVGGHICLQAGLLHERQWP